VIVSYMAKERALEILKVLLARTADCRCGNYDLSQEEVRAIQFMITYVENE
jgi:hypothetical protein